MQASSLRKRVQVARIGREEPIVVACEQHEGGVDDVGLPRAAKARGDGTKLGQLASLLPW
jgi:hypothetical protein